MSQLNQLLHPKALRYVAAVAQLGSVQAAAREVSISASAIDPHLRARPPEGNALADQRDDGGKVAAG